ncbi:unannotated protein [freshwater metagenome]|uniref:Unannotated protein n=1 Tax=freshwater metagenome TaxID=449393 RepID=A0A6J7KP31_9ZZZZ
MSGDVHAELGEEVVIIRRRMPHPDSLVEQELTGLAIAASDVYQGSWTGSLLTRGWVCGPNEAQVFASVQS